MSAGNVLVMTSTIAPRPGVHALARTDPALRLAEYLAAVDFYSPLVADGVFDAAVYIDNSGHALGAVERNVAMAGTKNRWEFVSYKATTPPDLCRYFHEANLLLEGVKRSRVITQAAKKADTVLWKVTGRYIIDNIDKIVNTWPAECDLYLNLRNLPKKVVDFYLVGARADVFEKFLHRDLGEFRTREDGEIILRRKIDAGDYIDLKITPRLVVTPRLTGVRGFDGASYKSARQGSKFFLRSAANIVAPWLWI